MKPTFAVLALFLSLATPATSHEFWISPEDYQVQVGENIVAEFRVGENLKGSGYPFIPRRATRFEVLIDGQSYDPAQRLGDRPALNWTAPADGLAVVVHETADSTLTYRQWEKFVTFAEHKDFEWALAQHAERGLPETEFKETYRRYAKSLVQVGSGAGADTEVGLETEIVALDNPYTDDLSDGLRVRVLYQGRPRTDAQVELFARGDDDTVVTLHRTDANGEVMLPMLPGTEYLVDAVVLRPVEPAEDGDPVWASLWAALTFRTPG